MFYLVFVVLCRIVHRVCVCVCVYYRDCVCCVVLFIVCIVVGVCLLGIVACDCSGIGCFVS